MTDTDTLLAFSYGGDDLKVTVGRIPRRDHLTMLIAAMDRVGAGSRYPALVSATDFHPAAWPDDGDRWLAWEAYRRARVVTHPTNPGHQLGACWCVRRAVEYAAATGSGLNAARP